MKNKLLQKFGFTALCLLCFFGKMPEAKAQAFDMIYRDTLTGNSLNSITHTFSFYLYQNCNALSGNFSNIPVSYSSKNPTVTETITGQMSILGMGNPFCASQPAVCSVTGPLNYQKTGVTYSFTTKIQNTPGNNNILTQFVVFGSGFGNFQSANLNGNFGIEPKIFNIITSGILNTPPEFINPPVIFANVNQPVSYSCGAKDADGDSLVYKLRPVSINATYAPGFTYLNPVTANPALALNSRTGVITFKPTAYDQAAGPGATANKYVIGLDVDEYRKLNGVTTKIGTIQRNVLVNIISNANQSPVLTAYQNATAIAPNTILDVVPGTQVTLNFSASDPDALDVVSPSTNAQNILPQASFSVTLGSNPNGGQLRWTPTVADIRDEPYFFNVTAQDNACPYPASVTNTYSIRVRNVTGMAQAQTAKPAFKVFPNPASGLVNFSVGVNNKTYKIVICNLLGQEVDEILVKATAGNLQPVRWEKAAKFAAGQYFAKLIAEGTILQTVKFSKL